MKYEVVTLGSLCKSVVSGGTPKSTISDYYNGGIPWLNTKEVHSNRIYKTEKTISELGLQNSSAKWIPSCCIIVAMYGATAGNIAINFVPLTTNQACCNLQIDETKADYRYVYYYLKANYTKLASLANGGAQQNLNAKLIKDFSVVLPSLQVQSNIADILWSVDDKIELNNKINENLEQQAQALYLNLFVDNADREWKQGTISDLGLVVGGSTPSKSKPEYYAENGIAWITPKDLSVNKSKFISHGANDITELGLKNSSASIMPEGAVLFSSRAPIGYIAIAAGEVTTNQGFKSVVPKPEIGTPFVYYFLKHNLPIIESMASGSTFKEVSGNTMKNVPAVIPDTETLFKFNDFCKSIFVQQQILEQQNQSLAVLRDSLLPKLMSGEIDVSYAAG